MILSYFENSVGLSKAHIPALSQKGNPDLPADGRRFTQIRKCRLLDLVMRQSWMAGRAVPCPPHDRSVAPVPLPMPDGGHRSARPAFRVPPETDAWLHLRPSA
jgi:hypothetical protein